MRKKRPILANIAIGLLLSWFMAIPVLAASDVADPALMISEVQMEGRKSDGQSDPSLEFVELYNPAHTAINITGWRIEYLSSAHAGNGSPTRVLVTLTGQLSAKGFVLIGLASYLPAADMPFENELVTGQMARSGGQLRIVNADFQVIDQVGWGSAVPSGNWPRVPDAPAGSSLQRQLPDTPDYVPFQYFISSSPTPTGGDLVVAHDPPVVCRGITLSEILFNPLGADAGQEFIEVMNTSLTEPSSLKGCFVRLGASGRVFTLTDQTLAPGETRAFYDYETHIILPNSKAQTLWLVTTDDEQAVTYDPTVEEGQAWAFIAGVWQRTELPTPNLPNMLVRSVAETPTAPRADLPSSCPIGKSRSPETGRCRTSESVLPAACKAGQERNPETGRCRNLTTTTSPSPCKQNQERSPETGRCREVLAGSTAVKPCADGHERNPTTNRCRKKTDGSSAKIATVQDVQASSRHNSTQWVVASAILVATVGYIVYEWRQDISNLLYRLKTKLKGFRFQR